ncbi:hypothetical protein HC031_27650 [Planosporangium thailandense]|uniref:Uncharacterized protein n=1 Tax=Planosporangium thailandense TaxID=765197 RepID=A0ABX0Y4Y4_9ACTN|nr:hypothetical protein [Planosporangium thailandense]NJC73471.1 hypothetical protein [Planosporangium thailandense]
MMPGSDLVRSRMGGAPRTLARGRWSVEVRGDEVADIRFDGVHLLRAIRPVVRDRDWNTVPVAVVSQHLTDADATLVTRLRFETDGIAYEATTRLRLHDDELTVDFDGRALVDFERNRIGLVVLHPAADAGRAVRVKHTDGGLTTGSWPTHISPHQPFRDVAGFEWRKDGVTATLSLSGDVFETEDQRNWTDASFKTYSTPLSLPFPVAVPAGADCHQHLRLAADGRAESGAGPSTEELTVSSTVAGVLPPVSLGASLYPPPARPLDGLAAYETVLVELVGEEERWPDQLRSAARQADALTAHLDVRVVTAEPDAIGRCVAQLAGLPVARLGVFDRDSHVSAPALWGALRDSVRRHGFTGQLVAGTRAHFTELNRNIHQIPEDADALTFSVTPQMHATEIPHLIDSLAMQRIVAENARRLGGGRPVLVGPVTLARRFNAVATTAAPDPAVDALRAIDPLQPTDFTAAWTLGSVASLAAAGVAGVCYFETGGPRGIVTSDQTVTPAGKVLNRIARLRGRPVLRCTAPDGIAALAVLLDGGSVELAVANLSATARTITVGGPGRRPIPVDLDGWSVHHATLDAPVD